MGESKHTQGPWLCYADTPSTDPNWHIVTNDTRIRVVANVRIEPGNVSDKHNALLITAAPELLEALTELNEALDDGLCNSSAPGFDSKRLGVAQDAARAAIARATGAA